MPARCWNVCEWFCFHHSLTKDSASARRRLSTRWTPTMLSLSGSLPTSSRSVMAAQLAYAVVYLYISHDTCVLHLWICMRKMCMECSVLHVSKRKLRRVWALGQHVCYCCGLSHVPTSTYLKPLNEQRPLDSKVFWHVRMRAYKCTNALTRAFYFSDSMLHERYVPR